MTDTTNALRARIEAALDYSGNFATAKPDIGATERQHILGLCRLLRDASAALATAQPEARPEGVDWQLIGYEYQHDTGRTTFVSDDEAEDFERLNERWTRIGPCYRPRDKSPGTHKRARDKSPEMHKDMPPGVTYVYNAPGWPGIGKIVNHREAAEATRQAQGGGEDTGRA